MWNKGYWKKFVSREFSKQLPLIVVIVKLKICSLLTCNMNIITMCSVLIIPLLLFTSDNPFKTNFHFFFLLNTLILLGVQFSPDDHKPCTCTIVQVSTKCIICWLRFGKTKYLNVIWSTYFACNFANCM